MKDAGQHKRSGARRQSDAGSESPSQPRTGGRIALVVGLGAALLVALVVPSLLSDDEPATDELATVDDPEQPKWNAREWSGEGDSEPPDPDAPPDDSHERRNAAAPPLEDLTEETVDVGRAGLGGSDRRATSPVPAIGFALDWLAHHQSASGEWKCDAFSEQCRLNKCDGPGEAAFTPGVTGLAMLCFLDDGQTHQVGDYKDVVKNGARYLKGIQDSDGCFGVRTSQHYQYNHACASLAITRLYGVTGSRLFKDTAQRAVDFVEASRNPYLGWRYGVRDGDNDTSVSAWMTQVLVTAAEAGLTIDRAGLDGAVTWVEKMTDPQFGRVGYVNRGGYSARTAGQLDAFPASATEAMTAAGILIRLNAGVVLPPNDGGVDLVSRRLPVWNEASGEIDMYAWMFGAEALCRVGGGAWRDWNAALVRELTAHQRLQPGRDEHGSWDPVGAWGQEGGRVYSTAVLCQCLQTEQRLRRQRQQRRPPPGRPNQVR